MKSEIDTLFDHFPEFKELRDNEDDISLSSVFGDFGLFLTDLILKHSSSENKLFYFSHEIKDSFSAEEVDKYLDEGFKYINDCISKGELNRIFFVLEKLTDFDETIDYCNNNLCKEGQDIFSEIIHNMDPDK